MRHLRTILRSHFVVPSRPHVARLDFVPSLHFRRKLSTEMETVNTSERLATLRDLMKQHEVDVYSTSTLPGSNAYFNT